MNMMSQYNWNQLVAWFQAHEAVLTWLGVLSVLMFFGTLIAVPIIIVALPHDLLTRENKSAGRQWLNLWYFPYAIAKNVIGVCFVGAGLAMLALPGQGLLTIFLGLALINFPGKKKLIRRLLGQKRINQVITRLRARFHKAPLDLPD